MVSAKVCAVEVCERPVEARGWCHGHYTRWKTHGAVGTTALAPRGKPDRARAKMRNRWRAMWSRCTDPSNKHYRNYGGRGITVCDRWRDFDAYLMDVGMPPAPGLSLDRINNDGPYEPGNVRWATAREQRVNQRPRASYWKRLAPCGTESAYGRHLRYGETPCPECRAAHAATAAAYRAERRRAA